MWCGEILTRAIVAFREGLRRLKFGEGGSRGAIQEAASRFTPIAR